MVTGSDDVAVRRDRDEKRRRRARTVRTVVLVVVLLAVAVGGMAVWMANRRVEYDGPWCVWARPTGGTVPVWGGTGAATTAPAFGDVRSTPGGAAAPGNWTSATFIVTTGSVPSRTLSVLSDDQAVSILAVHLRVARSVPNYVASSVQRTASDGTVWTAFMLLWPPADSTLPPVPDSSCAGKWTVTTDPTPCAAADTKPWTFDLLPSGEMSGDWPAGSWSVKDGVLAIQAEGTLWIGVLADDLRSFEGAYALGPIRGARTDR